MIAENVTNFQSRLRLACNRAGRSGDDVTLVAVSKTFGAEAVRGAFSAGLADLGENYVQELTTKRAQLADLPLRWHFIGRLQTNKVRALVDFIHLVHSVDSFRLAAEIDKRAGSIGRTIDVLIEVHTTDEPTKSGVPPGEVRELVKRISSLSSVRVQGLMTMGPFSDDPDDSRPSFRTLARLAREIEGEGIEGVSMKKLSMGMTHDFEIAVEEGATILRIGTAIFGERKKKQGVHV